MMKTLLLIIVLAACKSQQPQAPQAPPQAEPQRANDQVTVTAVIAKLKGFQGDMCRCKAGDSACADKVEKAMKDYARSKEVEAIDEKSISPDDEKQMMGIMSEMAKCQQAATGTIDRATLMEAMAKMEGFKDDMCRCKAGDKACSEKIEQAMKIYADSMKDMHLDQKSITPDDEKKMVSVMTDYMKCQQAALGTGGTGAP
ncbi:MAG TPA: hypothetical protein VNO30_08695 [Kofleriaceae bacterium]|nr:hypothetical protein [Kofleriaceae bacterium]